MIIYEQKKEDYKPKRISWMLCDTICTVCLSCNTSPALLCNCWYTYFNDFYGGKLNNSNCMMYAYLCASMNYYCDGITFNSWVGGCNGNENAESYIKANWLTKQSKGSFKGTFAGVTNWQVKGSPYICLKDDFGHSKMWVSTNGSSFCIPGCFNFCWNENSKILNLFSSPSGHCYCNDTFNLTGWDLDSLKIFICGKNGSQSGGGSARMTLNLGYYSSPLFEEIKCYYERFF